MVERCFLAATSFIENEWVEQPMHLARLRPRPRRVNG